MQRDYDAPLRRACLTFEGVHKKGSRTDRETRSALTREKRRRRLGRHPAPPSDGSAGLLDADHDDREGTRNRSTAAAATAAGGWRRPRRRRRRWRPGLRCPREQTARLAVKRECARAVRRPGLQVLLDLEARRALLLDDRHRAVALRTERFHRRRVKRRAVGAAGERQPREDLPILRTQDDERLRWLGVGIGRRRRSSRRW